jgi:hypothetical protein
MINKNFDAYRVKNTNLACQSHYPDFSPPREGYTTKGKNSTYQFVS